MSSRSSAHITRVKAALEQLEQRFFVGRRDECRLFARQLAERTAEWQILNLFGPAGVGKTTLLNAFRRIAEQSGGRWIYLDGADNGNSQSVVLNRLGTGLGLHPGSITLESCLDVLYHEAQRSDGPLVLALDSYEELHCLDRWLRSTLLAHLPQSVAVVVAGRFPLTTLWRELPAWRQLIRPLALEPFDLDLTRHYLHLHGIEDEMLIQNLWAFTQGHPLALSLAAALGISEGPSVLTRVADRPEVIGQLAHRWLREIEGDPLYDLVEAASINRVFDQDLLTHMLEGQKVSAADFARLAALSFVQYGRQGWSLHDLVRLVISRHFRQRSPERYFRRRLRALQYHLRRAVGPAAGADKGYALQEFMYLLGDEQIRVSHFSGQTATENDGSYVVPATAQDLPALAAYMHEWRTDPRRTADLDLSIIDPETGRRFRHVVPGEHNRLEVEYTDIDAFMALGPEVVRILREAGGGIRGISVIIPINADTLDFLADQPVTGPYFRQLSHEERVTYEVPPERTRDWYFRLVDVRDPADQAGRAALLRDQYHFSVRAGRILTSTPLPFYQALLQRFGFQEVPGATHFDFGRDRPSPTFILDLRGPGMTRYLINLAARGTAGLSARDQDLLKGIGHRLTGKAGDPGEMPIPPEPDPGRQAAVLTPLTPREREVALALLDGLSNPEIADRLCVREITVKKHLTRIFHKTGVASRTQLIKKLLAG